MAKSFDTHFRELVLAVALCDVENVKRILSSEWFEKNTIKIIDSNGNIRTLECDEPEKSQVPQIVFLEKYANAIRKKAKSKL